MPFEELKAGQAVMWGSGPYDAITALADSLDPERREELRGAWVELHEAHRVDGGISQPRLYLLTIGHRK